MYLKSAVILPQIDRWRHEKLEWQRRQDRSENLQQNPGDGMSDRAPKPLIYFVQIKKPQTNDLRLYRELK